MDFVDFGMGEPREETPAFIREALAAAIEPLSSYPRADGLPELRAAIAAWARAPLRRRARPGPRDRPDARLQGGDLPPRAGRRRRPRGHADARLPGLRARRARSPARRCWSCRCAAGRGFLPDLDAVDAADLGARRRAVAELPEQPDGGDRAASSSTSAPPRWRASTTSCWPPTRPTPSCTSAPSRPRRALQVADRTNVLVFNTLSKRSSMPGYRTGFAAGDPEVIAALRRYRPERRRRRRWRWSSARPRSRGATRRTSRRSATATAPSATCCCRCSSAAGCAPRAATRRSSSGSTAAPDAEALAARLIEGGVVVTPGSYFGAAGRGLHPDGAGAAAGRLRARGQPARAAAVSGHGAAASS